MARSTMDFAQQNTERATDWMRAIAEQNLNQSRAAFEGLLTVARNAVRAKAGTVFININFGTNTCENPIWRFASTR